MVPVMGLDQSMYQEIIGMHTEPVSQVCTYVCQPHGVCVATSTHCRSFLSLSLSISSTHIYTHTLPSQSCDSPLCCRWYFWHHRQLREN